MGVNVVDSCLVSSEMKGWNFPFNVNLGVDAINNRKRLQNARKLSQVHSVPRSAKVLVQCAVVSNGITGEILSFKDIGCIVLFQDSILIICSGNGCFASVKQRRLLADRSQGIHILVDNDSKSLVFRDKRDNLVCDVGRCCSDGSDTRNE